MMPTTTTTGGVVTRAILAHHLMRHIGQIVSIAPVARMGAAFAQVAGALTCLRVVGLLRMRLHSLPRLAKQKRRERREEDRYYSHDYGCVDTVSIFILVSTVNSR